MLKPQKTQTFWDRVKLAMIAKGRKPTQINAAKIAGRAQPTISEIWNKPGGAPELEVVVRLATTLEVCVEWLYTGRGPMKPAAAIDAIGQELLSVWDQLDEKTKRVIAGYALGRANGLGESDSGPPEPGPSGGSPFPRSPRPNTRAQKPSG